MYYLSFNGQYVVASRSRLCSIGRDEGCVIVCKDKSVSRRHGYVSIESTERNKDEEEKVILIYHDESKFGSYVNGASVAAGSTTELHCDDILECGRLNGPLSIKVYQIPLVLILSKVTKKTHTLLKEIAFDLGIRILSDWMCPEKGDLFNATSILIMEKVEYTLKLFLALASASPIVTPSWLLTLNSETGSCHQRTFALPAFSDYLPNNNAQVAIRTARKTLFNNKTILFLSHKEFETQGKMLALAGASVIVLDTSKPLTIASLRATMPHLNSISSLQQFLVSLPPSLSEEQKSRLKELGDIGFKTAVTSEAMLTNSILRISIDDLPFLSLPSSPTRKVSGMCLQADSSPPLPTTSMISDSSNESVEIPLPLPSVEEDATENEIQWTPQQEESQHSDRCPVINVISSNFVNIRNQKRKRRVAETSPAIVITKPLVVVDAESIGRNVKRFKPKNRVQALSAYNEMARRGKGEEQQTRKSAKEGWLSKETAVSDETWIDEPRKKRPPILWYTRRGGILRKRDI